MSSRWTSSSGWLNSSVWMISSLCFPGRQDSRAMDCSRGHCLQEVHIGVGCLELRGRDLGSDFLWRTTLLELVESGRHQGSRPWLHASTSNGKGHLHITTLSISYLICFLLLCFWIFLCLLFWLSVCLPASLSFYLSIGSVCLPCCVCMSSCLPACLCGCVYLGGDGPHCYVYQLCAVLTFIPLHFFLILLISYEGLVTLIPSAIQCPLPLMHRW